MPEYNPPMANTFCSLNIHCIFSTKERVPMLNPELMGTAVAFLGRYCQTKRYQTQMHRRGCRPRSFAAVITNHSSHRQSHSINKGWIIGLDSSDFSTTGQLQLATRLWRFQCERLPVARNHSLHPKSGRTPRTRTFQQEYVAFLKRHELSFDDKYLWD